jgi:oxygen-independent coproporphyrinogen-3 oxidase
MKKKEEMVLALAKEIQMRKSESDGRNVETIYFGGRTSVLTSKKLISYGVYENIRWFQKIEIP